MSTYHVRVLPFEDFNLRAEIVNIGAESSYRPAMPVTEVCIVKVERITPKLARFLYQEMLLEGGQVILPARMNDRSPQPVDILILGTSTQFQHLCIRIRTQDDELNLFADELERALSTTN
jgi:hypothetical protein